MNPIRFLTIRDNPQGPGLEVLAERPDGTAYVYGTSTTKTLWELRVILMRKEPHAEIVFDPNLVPDPEYLGREAA